MTRFAQLWLPYGQVMMRYAQLWLASPSYDALRAVMIGFAKLLSLRIVK